MEHAFVDIQAFRVAGEFRPKEVFVWSKNAEFVEFVEMPVSWRCLSHVDMRQANWLMERYHGLKWTTENDVAAETLIQKLAQNLCGKIVFVKGEEKERWLKSVLNTTTTIVLNLENLGCDINLHAIDSSQPNCGNHLGIHRHCAFRNVVKLVEWFNSSPFNSSESVCV